MQALVGPGAKLLIGPRGSGKSTLLRSAYYDLLERKAALPVYVNFSRSLALEPLFHTHSNALQLFRQWIVYKIIWGVREAFADADIKCPADLVQHAETANEYIHALEVGRSPARLPNLISPTELLVYLEHWPETFGARRSVLLLDDAAHAFSQEQQKEFFEVFRELRSRRVAGKAAVYPGITRYSPFFQAGHDASRVEVWRSPDASGYLRDMRAIVKRRLYPEYEDVLAERWDIVDYLAMASFGLPRGFLTMLSEVLEVDGGQIVRPTRAKAEEEVKKYRESVMQTFLALADKLPRYKNFVEVGTDILDRLENDIRRFNLKKPLGKKSVSFGVSTPIQPELDRILCFLEYAGVVRKGSAVSLGATGKLQRYTLHYAFLIPGNRLSLGKQYVLDDVTAALQRHQRNLFVRIRATSLLTESMRALCVLDLPPCDKCGEPRVEGARFCVSCGAELESSSVYKELLGSSIQKLPLSERRVRRIMRESSLRSVQDILVDEEQSELRSVRYIGPIWAARIRNYAEEYLGV